MKTIITYSFIASFGVLFVTSCGSSNTTADNKNTNTDNTISVIQTIEGLEPGEKTFTVSATKSSTVELPNGGSIEIPAGAFVDQNGKPVSGDVRLKWGEYHTLGEIALSGIPMQYDSAGYKSDLISGGMFNIDGEKNGEAVKIAPNKKLKVNLASSNPQETFNFYQLDEKTGEWAYETTKKASPVPGAPVEDVVEKVVIKQPYNLDLNVKIDPKQYPELKPDEILSWEVPASALNQTQINELKAEIVKAEIAAPTTKGHYSLKLEGKKFKYTVDARPVTFDNPPSNAKDIRNNMHKDEQDMNDYKKMVEADQLIRSIEIEGFGVYNWDIMYHDPSSVLSHVDLDIPDSNDEKFASFFFVSPKDKRIIPMKRKGAIRISMLVPACIIAITKNKEVFTVRNNMLEQVRKTPNKVSHSFTMKKVGRKIKSSKDLDQILDKCI